MKVTCDVIQDLLPSYIDGLTSEASNHLVKTHLEECENCWEMYDQMKQDVPNSSQQEMGHPSEAIEEKLVSRIKSKILTVIMTLIVTFTLIGFFIGAYGSVVFQEGNPIPIVTSILKIEFSDSEYVKFSSSPDRYITEFEEERYSVMKEYMKERGWTFKEQMGSGFIFDNEGEQLVVETRQYTRNYYIWDVPPRETKQ
ncbi:zf-HC2 domain-containing protein [Bacillaceae bacterium S4-13-56]